MKALEEALNIIQEHLEVLPTEQVSIQETLNRVLGEDLFATENIPPFNKAAMDGYACKVSDLNSVLSVVDFIPAGKLSTVIVNSGECVKIMTGAPVPEGADIVIMKEYVDQVDEDHIQYNGNSLNTNICIKGEDIKPGALVIESGTLLQSTHIAVIAGLGREKVTVFQQPKVAVLSTGSELVEPGTETVQGQIFNSNGHQLSNRIAQLGFPVTYAGIIEDDYELLRNRIEELYLSHDIIIISGGVSVGDLDLVPQVYGDMGFDIQLSTISTKPGKHTLFASKKGKYVLGLPGNPVSSYVQLEVVGWPLLFGLMNHRWKPVRMTTHPAKEIKRKKDDRLEFIPVRITDSGTIERIEYHGSAHMHALIFADALMEFPIGVKQYLPTDTVYVRPI